MKNYKWLLFFSLIWGASANAGQTGLYYKVQYDSGVRNHEVFYTDVQRKFYTLPGIGSSSDEPSSVDFLMTPTPDSSSFLPLQTTITFSAPGGAPMAIGSYQDTVSDNSTSQPRLSIYGGELANCSSGSGNFDIKEILYEPGMSSITSFAADFVYRCESTAQTTYGSVRYNSDVPFPESMPVSIGSDDSLNSKSCFEATSMDGGTVALHTVNGSDDYHYTWSAKVEDKSSSSSCSLIIFCAPQLPATSSTLRTLSGEGETFAFDLARSNSELAKVVLTATNAQTGEVQEARLSACVSDSIPPKVTIRSPRDGQHITGNNFILDVSVEDSVDPNPVYYAMLGIYVIKFEAGKPVRVEVPETFRGKGEPIPLALKVKARDASYNWVTEERNVTVEHDRRN